MKLQLISHNKQGVCDSWRLVSTVIYPDQLSEDCDWWMCLCLSVFMCVHSPVHECVYNWACVCISGSTWMSVCKCGRFIISCVFSVLKTFYHIGLWRERGSQGKRKEEVKKKERILSCLGLHPGAGAGSDTSCCQKYLLSPQCFMCSSTCASQTFLSTCAYTTMAPEQLWRGQCRNLRLLLRDTCWHQLPFTVAWRSISVIWDSQFMLELEN